MNRRDRRRVEAQQRAQKLPLDSRAAVSKKHDDSPPTAGQNYSLSCTRPARAMRSKTVFTYSRRCSPIPSSPMRLIDTLERAQEDDSEIAKSEDTIDMQVTEAWIAIEISNGTVVIAYGPFDTIGEAMRFTVGYDSNMRKPAGYDGELVVRKLRRPPFPHLWRSRKVREDIHTKRHERLVELLVAERKSRKIRQQKLARKLRRHQSWIARLESGQRRIDIVEFLRLADVIGFNAGKVLKQVQAA